MIYDINKNPIYNNTVVTKNCTYFFALNRIKVEVLSGDCIIFLATDTNIENVKQSKTGFDTFEIGYTLFIEEDNSVVKLRITDTNGDTNDVTFNLHLNNVTPEKYQTLLTNYRLPTYDEIQPAVIDGKPEIIKRLLLDFKEILKFKGTKHGIEKFLYLLGYTDEQISITEEYKKFNELTNAFEIATKHYQTENDNEIYDENSPRVKTGNYYLTLDTWKDSDNDKEQELTSKNLPKRILQKVQYRDKLLYAIALANKYFTTIEQDIVFFGFNYSSNIEIFESFTCNTCQIFHTDINRIKNLIDIRIFSPNKFHEKKAEYIVYKNVGKKNPIAYRTESKYLIAKKSKRKIFEVETFWYDTSEKANSIKLKYRNKSIENYAKSFGAPLRMLIKTDLSEELFSRINIKIYNKDIIFDVIEKNITEDLNLIDLEWLTLNPGEYKIEIKAFDKFGNYETFNYNYTVLDAECNFIFNLLTSNNFQDNRKFIDLDVDAPSRTTISQLFYDSTIYKLIHNNIMRYENLDSYYNNLLEDVDFTKTSDNMSFGAQYYLLPDIDDKNKVSDITDTLPIKHLSQWFEYVLIPIEANQPIKITKTCFDYSTLSDILIELCNTNNESFDVSINQQKLSKSLYNDLFIHKIHIENDKSYLFISTFETGVNFIQNTFDLYLNDISIYKVPGMRIIKQPLNADIPLHNIQDTLDLLYNGLKNDSIKNEMGIVETVYPVLGSDTNFDFLKIGDIVLIKPDDDHVVNMKDITWIVRDSFTNEELLKTNDFALKYRITNKTIFDVVCDFQINDKHFIIEKNNIISSYEF